ISEDGAFIDACRSYFDRLWDAAGSDLTAIQLDEWDAQVTSFLASGGRPRLEAALPDYGVVVNDDPLTTIMTPGWPAESSQSFVKFFGEGNRRLPWTFEVFEEVDRAGCHWACTYPRGKRPRQVCGGDTLFT